MTGTPGIFLRNVDLENRLSIQFGVADYLNVLVVGYLIKFIVLHLPHLIDID